MIRSFLIALVLLLNFSGLFAQGVKYVNAKHLNLRATPQKAGVVMQTLPSGTEVEIVQEDQAGWTRVAVNGQEGYLASQYLRDALQGQQAATSPDIDTTTEVQVFVCDSKSGSLYHISTACRGLNRCTQKVTGNSPKQAVQQEGRSACPICY